MVGRCCSFFSYRDRKFRIFESIDIVNKKLVLQERTAEPQNIRNLPRLDLTSDFESLVSTDFHQSFLI